MKKRISILINDETYHKFKIYAVRKRRTISSEIEKLLEKKINEEENNYAT